MDTRTYRRHQREKRHKGRVVALTVFADGVQCQNVSFYTLIIKVNDLNCGVRAKTFLNGAALRKPDLNQFLQELIVDLNNLWNDGIQAEKFGELVFPFVQEFIMDGKARPDLLLLQSNCNTKNHCNQCYVKGRTMPFKNGRCRVFVHTEEVIRKRSHEESQLVADAIACDDLTENDLPYNGIKIRTPLYDLALINIIQQVPSLEPMHTFFAGFVRRDFESMQFYPNRHLSCFLPLFRREILQSRMDAVHINSNFNLKFSSEGSTLFPK